jgi:hypothetical protein
MLLLATPRCIENNLREIKRVGMTPRKPMAEKRGLVNSSSKIIE